MSKHEKITAAELNKKASPHCDNCGSDDLMADARSRWNAERQEWEVAEVDEDSCVCCHCGRGCTIRWRLS